MYRGTECMYRSYALLNMGRKRGRLAAARRRGIFHIMLLCVCYGYVLTENRDL